MVSPEMPTGDLIGHTVLHSQPDGQSHDPLGVAGLGRGQVGHVGGEVTAALGDYPETYLLAGFDLRHIGDRRSEWPSREKQGNPIRSAKSNLT